MENSADQLDVEYRAFVRLLHKDAVHAVINAHQWWRGDVSRIVMLGGYDDSGGQDSEEVAKALELRWRNEVLPQLEALAHGHPDPDVRLAADVLVKRVWSIILILIHPRTDEGMESSEKSVAVHLVHDGFTRLHKAVYHAPFRVDRPSPIYEGTPVSTYEPLPGEMLKQIKKLQDEGLVAPDNDILRGWIPEGVKKLSDLFFTEYTEESIG